MSPLVPEAGVSERYLLPGEVGVAAAPTRFTTVLGSCVALCLYDSAAGIGGINHFLLPDDAPAGDVEPLRWCTPSCERLLRDVLLNGARRQRVQAKLFGGACVGALRVPAGFRVGERNVESAQRWLLGAGLSVAAADVGGSVGRKLVFDAHSGMAWVKSLAYGGN